MNHGFSLGEVIDGSQWPDVLEGMLLVRHPQVDSGVQGLCYGRSDVPLSLEGVGQSQLLADRLARLPVRRIFHSGLQRTRVLAQRLGELTGIEPRPSEALVERDFGDWELQSWEEIYRREGEGMLRMISEPETYRPGGGETTWELADRVWNGLQGKRAGCRQGGGLTVAVTHGGPIAAYRGRLGGLPVADWPSLIPACGTPVWIEVEKPLAGSAV
ncbi:histidine phosphatase family protein [Candidatus Laterigemmans baculatus]|uniref:histidine phosphatase family protein n=1 Tax=Candidatus Laterigemmans baculatus TaxID=2770505 RepID=UPI0013DC41F2|nr:histidine phosphatase family protein [Candidatus Laterigemmans baculatus]